MKISRSARVAFGLLGKTFAVAGLQRWVSLTAGAIILIAVVVDTLIRRAVAKGGGS